MTSFLLFLAGAGAAGALPLPPAVPVLLLGFVMALILAAGPVFDAFCCVCSGTGAEAGGPGATDTWDGPVCEGVRACSLFGPFAPDREEDDGRCGIGVCCCCRC